MAEDLTNEAIKQLNEISCKLTEIIVGNPSDLVKMDMSLFPSYCFFISNQFVERGTLYLVKDGEMKTLLFEFINKYPDKVFRGTRCEA